MIPNELFKNMSGSMKKSIKMLDTMQNTGTLNPHDLQFVTTCIKQNYTLEHEALSDKYFDLVIKALEELEEYREGKRR
jgi:hypothetical protein